MSSGAARLAHLRPRTEFTLVLLLGAVGAGLVFLAMRQGWAQVRTAAPKPLPASVASVSGQDLVPAADALALAALASLAAVLATRRLLRRVAGVVLAGFGAGIVAAVAAGISAADVRAAGAGGGVAGAGSEAGAGSVTAGSTAGGSATPLAGFPGHVAFVGLPWRGLAVAGALALVAAGVLVIWRAKRWPVMSSRYELPGRAVRAGAAAAGPAGAGSAAAGPAGGAGGARGADTAAGDGGSRSAASMWESLSRGEDPTSVQAGPGWSGAE